MTHCGINQFVTKEHIIPTAKQSYRLHTSINHCEEEALAARDSSNLYFSRPNERNSLVRRENLCQKGMTVLKIFKEL